MGKSLSGARDVQELFSVGGNVVGAQVTAITSEFPQTILSVPESFNKPQFKNWMHEIIYSDIQDRV